MLNTMTEAEIEKTTAKITDTHPEETRRMKKWLEDRITASKKKPSAEIVTLTPVLAQLLLDRNPKNRPLSMRNVDCLTQDIANGAFVFNGESIVVTKTGVMGDGQHRCIGVLQTGKSIEVCIVFGPEEDTRYTIDSGKSKTLSNYLAMKGRLYTHALGPAVTYYLQWRQYGTIARQGANQKAMTPTKAAVLKGADNLRGFDASIEFTAPCMKTTRSHAVLAFCHYAFVKRTDRATADWFVGMIINGEGLRKGDPAYYCRERLLNLAYSRAEQKAEVIFRCWNAWRRNEKVNVLRLTGGDLPKLEA